MKKTVCLLLALLVMMTAAVLTGCGGIPGSNSIYVAGVRDNGNADEGGFAAINTMIAVRPVIWVTTG